MSAATLSKQAEVNMLELQEHRHADKPSTTRLPRNRSHWPYKARQAFKETLAELNAWDRDHEHRTSLNHWIAEQAVREVWAPDADEIPLSGLKVA